MKCECGRELKSYVVTVDEEQYVEDLCPRCAFPESLRIFDASANPDFVEYAGSTSSITFRAGDPLTLTLEVIDDAMAKLNAQGKSGKMLLTSPGTLKNLSKELGFTQSNSIPIKFGSVGRVLEVLPTKELVDNESVIVDDTGGVHPVTCAGNSPAASSAAFNLAVSGAYSRAMLHNTKVMVGVYGLLPKKPWTAGEDE